MIAVSQGFRERQEFAGSLLPRIDGIIGVRINLDPPDVPFPRRSPFADRGLTEFRLVCSEGSHQSGGVDVNEPLRDRRQIARIGEEIDQQKRIPRMRRPVETAARRRRRQLVVGAPAMEVLLGEHGGRFVWLAFRRRQVRVRPVLKSSRACRCSEAPAPGMHAPAEPRAAGALFLPAPKGGEPRIGRGFSRPPLRLQGGIRPTRKEHIANREQIVYIGFLARRTVCRSPESRS